MKKSTFLDEASVQQFSVQKYRVWRPVGAHYEEKCFTPTVKHPLSQIIWEAMSSMGTAGLFFLPPGATMNNEKYVNLLKSKFELHMRVHNCEIFIHDGQCSL